MKDQKMGIQRKVISLSLKRLYLSWFLTLGITTSAIAQMNFQPLKILNSSPNSVANHPQAALIQGADGAFYGTTANGGNANAGTVFKINPDGSGYMLLHCFGAMPDGCAPGGRLVQGPDGTLYGTTILGGSNNLGTIFSLSTNGSNYMILHHFSTNALDGQFPHTGLIFGSDGGLYGSAQVMFTNISGPYFITFVTNGIVYRINPDGSGFTVLTNVCHSDELLQGRDGLLYGIAEIANSIDTPVSISIFKLSTNGSGYAVLTNFNFSAPDGRSHHTGMIQGTDGVLYGTVYTGIGGSQGCLFSINTDGSGFTTLHTFSTNSNDGLNPDCRLYQGNDGLLYGTTINGGTNGDGTVFSINTNGSNFALLHSFNDVNGDGRWPCDTLLQTADGSLYGVTRFGGSQDGGVIFKTSTDGNTFSVLYNFKSFSAEGQNPVGPMTLGDDGAFYGVTTLGGVSNNGVIFKYTTNNEYAVVHDFTGNSGDGRWPMGVLCRGHDGALYGTTALGGTNDNGTIYKIGNGGTGYTVLYNFSAIADGALPSGTLVQDTNGLLWGITGAGGTNQVGTIFQISTNGSGYAVLHHFLTNDADGWGPVSGLARGCNDAFYGTTANGGGITNSGTVFKIDADGNSYVILHRFTINNFSQSSLKTEGSTPYGGLLAVSNVLYGTARWGGAADEGILFNINNDGTGYRIVHQFQYSNADGQEPVGDLIRAQDGGIYGTAFYGGVFMSPNGANNYDSGAIFELCPDNITYLLVASFCKTNNYGDHPTALTEDADGSLYGTVRSGGISYDGGIFRLIPGVPQILTQPSNLVVNAGQNAIFNVAVIGGGLKYQWLFQGQPLANEQNFSLVLPNVVHSNAGIYSIIISNTVNSVVSTNAVLRVLVAQTLSAPTLLPDGSFQLAASYSDGWQVDSNELGFFTAMVSSNLTTWRVLTNSLTWTNGTLILHDIDSTNQPTQFYKIIEN